MVGNHQEAHAGTDREHEYLDLLVSHRVDGIVSGAHNEDLPEYGAIRMPLVAVDRDLSPAIPNVHCANEEGGRTATGHLLERGARRPALLTSRTGAHNRREAGYRDAMARAGVEPVVLTVDFHTPAPLRAAAVADRLDPVADLVDAVFATDDLSAAEVLEWARGRGLRVPEDFKVVGFDGTLAVRRALPGLTTIRQPIAAIAREAVALLVAQIEAVAAGEDPRASLERLVELPGELVVGRTT